MDAPKNLCIFPWVHTAVDIAGELKPCCRFSNKPNELPTVAQGLKQGWSHGDYYSKLRQQFLNNEQPSGCSRCFKDEQTSGKSMRTDANNTYLKDNTFTKPPKLKFLEMAFSHHCNLACRMCNEGYSSKWLAIKRHTNTPLTEDVTEDLDFSIDWFDTDLSSIERVKLVGGEPLLAKQHDEFIKKLASQSSNINKVQIDYHTNATILPSKKVLETWKKLKALTIVLSIDGYGKLNETLRPGPYKWKDIDNTFNFYLNLKDTGFPITMRVHFVVSRFNIFNLQPLLDYIESKGTGYSMDIARRPFHMCIANMDPKDKELAKEYIKNLDIYETFRKRLLNTLEQESEKTYTDEQIINKEKVIDNYFNQDIRELL
jgi:sulfatase maturation enzyme AslB (radical SAM superfamily)